MTKAAKRRLGVYSLGILRNRALCKALGTLGWEVVPGFFSRNLDAVGIWGASRAAERGRAAAQRRGLPIVHLEDAPLRSVTASNAEPLMGLFIDETGNHLDASGPSDLERLLNKPLGDLHPETDALLEAFTRSGLSKYNDANRDPGEMPQGPFVLVIDQLAGDASITLGSATEHSFKAMLSAAIAENPDLPIVIKRHPRAVNAPHLGHFSQLPDGVRFLEDGFKITDLLDRAKSVYTVTSQVGFEAILRGKRPRVFGAPFYSSWGLSDDEISLPRRVITHTPRSLFQKVMMEHAVWIDPCGGGRTDLLSAIRGLDARRKSYFVRSTGAVALGMKPWKRTFLGDFLGSVQYASNPQRAMAAAKQSGRPIVVWASAPEQAALPPELPHLRMEDGFLRSVGLGAALHAPQSLVLDDLGIYYDPNSESRLERQIIASLDLSPLALRRAESLRRRICELGLSKYNVGNRLEKDPTRGQRTILVPGQVEDDASILRGTDEVTTNLDLLKAVRGANPEARILYKPHPDVEAELRAGAVSKPSALEWADEVVERASAHEALAVADEVHTMTSLMGFEALLRGMHVVTYGHPFYAGWGLTKDHGGPLSRRGYKVSLDGLVHACLIDYPLYRDAKTGLACPVETVVERLAVARTLGPRPISKIVKVSGKLKSKLGF